MREPGRGRGREKPREPARPAIPAGHPALVVPGLLVAALAAIVVTFPIADFDLWQHLAVGKHLWQSGSIPQRHLWSWPAYGEPGVPPSWLFRALLWPVWEHGGVAGLFAWRWITTLAALALGWATARRMGARGASPLVALALGAMVYRERTMMRPETLAAPLLAATLLVLEWRRQGGRLRLAGRAMDPSLLLVPLAWVWVNVHVSHWLLFFTAGAYALDARFDGAAAGRGARPRALILATLAAAAAALANPFGWRLLWEPFEYFLFWRGEPIFRTIGELRPVFWSENLRNGLPVLVVAWPLLAARRLLSGRRDLAELALCGTLLALTLTSQRFMGTLAIASIPFLARDLSEWVARGRGRWFPVRPWPRAGLALAAVLLLAAPLLARADRWFGVRMDFRKTPVAACDFLERHELRGRLYNPFWFGGYLLWRFWPDPGRLPFMDAHVVGARRDRDDAAFAPDVDEAWRSLDDRHHFEIVVAPRFAPTDVAFLERRDADPDWALVFADDVAAVYLRRGLPRFAPLVERYGYRLLSGGSAGLEALYPRVAADSALRSALRREMDRAVGESRASGQTRFMRAALAALEGRPGEAEADLRAALAADPDLPRARGELGALIAARGRHREALAWYREEGSRHGWPAPLRVREAVSLRALGDVGGARASYRRALAADPANVAARDSLAALGERGR